MFKTLLITGGAGFIGSHIVDACMERGYRVIILDNLSGGSLDNIGQYLSSERFMFVQGDICDTTILKKIFTTENIDTVFHLAAQINVRESIRDPERDITTNIQGTTHLLEAMRHSLCRRIIFSSTGGALFSGGTPPYTESDIPNPSSPYGISKFTGEMLIDFYAKTYDFAATILRYANVYGPRQNATGEAGVVSIFQENIARGETPTIYGDGTQTRDFIHVNDVVSANIHVMERDIQGTYHVGTGIETSICDLWDMLAREHHSDLIPRFLPSLGEIQRSSLDSTRLQALGWRVNCILGDQ